MDYDIITSKEKYMFKKSCKKTTIVFSTISLLTSFIDIDMELFLKKKIVI